MAFAYASNVITQTGTDTSLAGLSGLTGVTTYTPSDADNPITYELSGVQLQIQGTLSFNAATEKIRFINVLATQAQLYVNGGNLTVTAENTVNSVTNPFPGMLAIEFDQGALGFGGYNSISTPFYMSNGASSATLSGTYIIPVTGGGGAIMLGGGTLTLVDAVVVSDASTNNTQLRQGAGSLNLQRVVMYGIALQTSSGTIDTFDDVTIRDNNEGLVMNTNQAGNYKEFGGLNSINAGAALRINGSSNPQHAKLLNPSFGANFTWSTNQGGSVAHRVAAVKRVDVAPVDENSISITAKYYAIDNDSGNRGPDYTENSTGNVYNTSGDIIYTGETSSDTVEILISSCHGANIEDNRGINANGDIPFKWMSYLHGFTTATPSALGITNVASSPILITDSLITETTKATVDAYTEIETPYKFYDRAKADLYDNFAGEAASTVGRSGDIVQAGSKNIVVDASAVSIYDLSGSTITIKTSAYSGGFQTSGAISQLNGATISDLVLSGGATWNAVQSTWTGSAGAAETIDVANVGTYDATGFVFDASTTLNNSSGGAIDVVITSGQQTPTVTGGTVNFIAKGATVTFSNLTSSNVQIMDDSDVVQSRQVSQTGTYQYTAPNGSTGTWCAVVNRAGYEPISFMFDPIGNDASVDSALDQKLRSDGSAMYNSTTSPFLTVVPQADGSRMNLRIGDGSVSAQACFDESEDALQTQDGMSYLCNGGGQVAWDERATGTFLDLKTNVRLIRDLAGDVNATVVAIVSSTDGTVIDGTNGSVSFAQPSSDVNVVSVNGTATTGVDDFKADISSLSTSAEIAALNDLSTADIDARLAVYDAPTLAEMTAAFTEIKGAGWTTTDTLEAIRDAISSGGLTAADVWTYVTRGLTEEVTTDSASRIASQADVSGIPTNPVLSNDSRLDNLDAAISTRSTLTAQQVWEYVTRTVTSIGTLVSDIWNNPTRTVTGGTIDTNKDMVSEPDNVSIVKAANQAELARKHLTNRDRIDETANTLTRYDDDKTTPLVVFDLKDGAGSASSDPIFEKDPR